MLPSIFHLIYSTFEPPYVAATAEASSFSYTGSGGFSFAGFTEESLDITWNTESELFYYQVQGECINPTCENTGLDPSDDLCEVANPTFIQVIAARGLSDLCEKLNNSNSPLKWPIQSIKKHSVPVYQTPGVDYGCNVFEEQDLEQVADCLNLITEPSSSFSYTGSGGFIFGGTGFPDDTEVFSDTLSISDGLVNTECGCNGIGLQINLRHNLSISNPLGDFLRRTGNSIPGKVSLEYNSNRGSWIRNYNFSGGGERWSVLFEWGCTDEVSGELLSTSAWKLSVYVSKIASSKSLDSRILFVIPQDVTCLPTTRLKFNVRINTITKTITSPSNPRLYVLTDKLGLFKSSYWVKNPNLEFNITELNNTDGFNLVDITSAVNA